MTTFPSRSQIAQAFAMRQQNPATVAPKYDPDAVCYPQGRQCSIPGLCCPAGTRCQNNVCYPVGFTSAPQQQGYPYPGYQVPTATPKPKVPTVSATPVPSVPSASVTPVPSVPSATPHPVTPSASARQSVASGSFSGNPMIYKHAIRVPPSQPPQPAMAGGGFSGNPYGRGYGFGLQYMAATGERPPWCPMRGERMQNPVWPWVLGGAAVAGVAGYAAYKCWPRTLYTDSVALDVGPQSVVITGAVRKSGCDRYELVVQGAGTSIIREFDTLQEAEDLWAEIKQAAEQGTFGEGPEANPAVATIFSPALYSWGMAPYYFPQTAFGGYGTGILA